MSSLIPLLVVGSTLAVEPLVELPLADPVVMKRDGWWYITGTENYFYQGKKLSRTSLERKPLTLETGKVKTAGAVWGISFYQHTDGSWHGYGTLHLGYFRTVIAHFTPVDPAAKWTPGNMIDHWTVDRILIGDIESGKTSMYDQKMYRTKEGLFLVYNASSALGNNVSILAQRMLDPETLDPKTAPVCLLRPEGLRSEDRNHPGGMQLTEGCTIREVNGKYILLYSVGDFKTANYKLGMAWSDSFIPPSEKTYNKVKHPDSDNTWGNSNPTDEIHYLLQSSKPEWPNYCGTWIKGPGIGNLVFENGSANLVFHGYPTARDSLLEGGRMTFKLPCKVSVSDSVPPDKWIHPIFPKAPE